MSVVALKDVAKSYALYKHGIDRLLESMTGKRRHQEFSALHSISLDIPHGQVVGIIGRNGAGKSTLLKLIAGTLQPSHGSVHVDGRISALLELGTGFHPEMTGRENVYLSAAIKGIPRAQIDRLYDDIVSFADLPDFMDQPVKTYSSGMFVRLAFAVATCVEPDILIIDEALSVGDGAFARKSFDRIMSFKQANKTILFCSHSMYQVEAICSRVIWLEQGRVQMDGRPDEVVSAYNTFIGGSSLSQSQGSPSQPIATVAAAVTPGPRAAAIRKVEVHAGGQSGPALDIETNKTDLTIDVSFTSDPELPAPSVAVAFVAQDGTMIASAGSRNDGLWLKLAADGRGEVQISFPAFPLLKGRYWVNIYLLCENAIHLYDHASLVAELRVQQQGLEQGVVSLPHRWSGQVSRHSPGPFTQHSELPYPARTAQDG